jgi:hypothetical protein
MKLVHFSTGNSYLDPAVERYVMHGLGPGGFLSAVIAGDEERAHNSADVHNKPMVGYITEQLINHLPQESMGSYDAMENWMRDVDNVRSAYVAEVMSQRAFDLFVGQSGGRYLE